MEDILNCETGVFTYPSKLDGEFCDMVISLAGKSWSSAEVESDESCKKVDVGLRTSKIYWTSEQWLVEELWPFMEVANELSGLMYEIEKVETMQLTKYCTGDFYDFHIDSYGSHQFKDTQGKVRKLSMTVQLNDDYEGGEFQVARCVKGEVATETLCKEKGTVIVFPSVLEHRVKSVTRGIRYSLVAWFLGEPFR
tara:strand:- start:1508 stop:2092 length:585 start_codon:yes stop_codon:yes gene_type:complete